MKRRTRLRIYGIAGVVVACVEAVLCFTGPMAFVHRPSLLVFPLFSHGVEDSELRDLTRFVEKEIALSRSYAIVSLESVEDRILHTQPDGAVKELKPLQFEEAQKLAQELGLERFATGSVFCGVTRCDLSLTVRDVRTGDNIRTGRFSSDTLEEFLKGQDREGNPLEIGPTLAVEIKGISITDYLILLLLAAQLGTALLALAGRQPTLMLEILWSPALMLFLFAFIYARSANMDYMQRFIANSGQLNLAGSTALEQIYAVLRYGPILVLNGVFYVIVRRDLRPAKAAPWTDRVVKNWALPWTLLAALLFALSFPSFASLDGFGFLGWFATVPLFLVLLTGRTSMGIFYGVVFGALQALIVNYWHGTYNYVTLHLVTIALVVEFTLFMLLLVPTIRLSGKWGFLSAACLWTLFDYLRSVGVLGYPWALAGTSQYRFLPLIQMASITGVWGLSFLVILANAAVAWTLVAPSRHWAWLPARSIWIRNRLPVPLTALVLAACVLTGSLILIRLDRQLEKGPQVKVVLVQQNRDPRKHAYEEAFGRLMTLTDQAVTEIGSVPDLVAWPEGAFKLDMRYWSQPGKRHYRWSRILKEFVTYQKGLGGWLLTGTSDHKMVPDASADDGKRKENYNSTVLMDPEGRAEAYYHKMRLVPFTEHFPLDKERFAGLYELFQKFDISNWGVGTQWLVFEHPAMRFITPICFEDVFSHHIRTGVLQEVDLILNVGNDYWSLSPVEGKQHGILALFRAVENQRPVLRSTASGYTVHIDAAGRIQPGAPPFYQPGYLVAEVSLPPRRLTPYTRWGDWFPYFLALLQVTIVAVSILRIVRLRKAAESIPHPQPFEPGTDGVRGVRRRAC